MAVLTPLDMADAQRLGAEYGLDVRDVAGIARGSVNSNFALTLADDSRVFLRIYEEQARPGAEAELRLLAHLAASGVATPRPMERLQGGCLSTFQDKPVALFPWVEGDMLCQKGVTETACRKLGRAIAATHEAGLLYSDAPASRFDEAALLARLVDVEAGAPHLLAEVDELRASLRICRGERSPRARFSLVHADLFRDNVLWQDGEIAALLDFESACAESRGFDLMTSLFSFCWGDKLVWSLARALVGGYEELRPLDREDREHLFGDALFSATRFTITRLTDFELRPRGQGVFKDYRRFLARNRAVLALGKVGIEGLLEGR